MTRDTPSFSGNKRFLPSKPCAACGRPMTWRKRLAKNWDEVKYCSDACRLEKFAGDRLESAPSSMRVSEVPSRTVRLLASCDVCRLPCVVRFTTRPRGDPAPAFR